MNAALPSQLKEENKVTEWRLQRKRLRTEEHHIDGLDPSKTDPNCRMQWYAKTNHAFLSKAYTPDPKCIKEEKEEEDE